MEAQINLREHQKPMAKNIDSLYSNNKRFAGVVLATGGGKSFLAMDQIIKKANIFNEENELGQPDIEQGILSNLPMYYFSPTNIILYQFQLHMAQNVIAPEYLAQEIKENGEITQENSKDVISRIIGKMNSRINVDTLNIDEVISDITQDFINSETAYNAQDIVKTATNKVLEKIDSAQMEKISENAFPNITFTTYSDLERKTEKQIKEMDPRFVIFDEAHRTGAEKWWDKVKLLVQSSKADVLAITATPERDVDEKDMMRDLALLEGTGYSVREVREKKYLAGNMPLLKSIEEGHIMPPEVVHFNCTLDETPEYENALNTYIKAIIKLQKARSGSNAYANASNNLSNIESRFAEMLVLIRKNPLIYYDKNLTQEEKNKLKVEDEEKVRNELKHYEGPGKGYTGVLAEISDIVKNGIKQGMSEAELIKTCSEKLNSEEWKKIKSERISSIIDFEVEKREISHGKAITFIESMDKGPKGETKEEKKDRAKNYIQNKIEEIKKLFNRNVPDVSAVHSTAYTDKENESALQKFMEASIKKGPMKIIAAVSKFNEGFHPDGIKALLMTKPIAQNDKKENEPRIILLQQIGRCLSASGKKDRATIFDIAGNFMRNHEKFKTEVEKDCFKFLDLSEEERQFLSLSEQINKSTKTKNDERPDTQKLVKILDVLRKNNIVLNADTISEDITLNAFIENIKVEELREKVLDDLFLQNIEIEDDGKFELGKSYRFSRDVLLGISEDKTALKKLKESLKDTISQDLIDNGHKKGIKQYEIDEKMTEMLIKLGIIDTQTIEGKESLKGRVNNIGFIVRGVLENTFAYNVFTGTKYDGPETDIYRKDYYGCLPNGRDIAGFDKYGFNESGIHRTTGKNYDERHFSPRKSIDETGKETTTWVYLNPETGEENDVDPLGFNHEGINPRTGFDRQGYWHDKDANGEFSIIRTRLNQENKDVHGFKFKGNDTYGELAKGVLTTVNGLYSNGTTLTPKEFRNVRPEQLQISRYGHDERDIDGFDRRGFDRNGIHKETSTKYDLSGRSSSKELHPDLRISKQIITLLLDNPKLSPSQICGKLRISVELVDKVIDNSLSMLRTFPNIRVENKDIIDELLKNSNALDKIFELSPSAGRQYDAANDDKKKLIQYFTERTDKIYEDMQKKRTSDAKEGEIVELQQFDKNLKKQNIGAIKYRNNDDNDFSER